MPERVHGHLSRRAQLTWPRALVVEREDGEYELRRPDLPVLLLGATFGDAKEALRAVRDASA